MDPDVTLYVGDALEVLRELPDASVDSVVCDPPYGINFMGKAWDGKAIEEAAQRESGRDFAGVTRLTGGADSGSRKLIERTGSGYANRAGAAGAYDFSARGNRAFRAWCEQWGAECLRVLKPGGHLLSFGGTRTYHRLACGLEDAGFEIRDCLCWLYGQGFPKSLDVSKAIDARLGVKRTEVVGHKDSGLDAETHGTLNFAGGHGRDETGLIPILAPATPAAAAWEGWGTALKPAFEPIVLARKPLAGTVAANVLEHGTGALNIDACRVGVESGTRQTVPKKQPDDGAVTSFGRMIGSAPGGNEDAGGRWPANLVLDEEAAAMLDEQTGELHSPGNLSPTPDTGLGVVNFPGNAWDPERNYADSGGASRFFYCAKVSRAERNAGLDGFPLAKSADDGYGSIQTPILDRAAPRENWEPHRTANNHPTVKPISLMRWLVRLVTPPGGLVLDPFLGSGTTGIAAALEGFHFLGIEREADYMRIAAARLGFWREHGEDGLRIVALRDAAERVREIRREAGQLNLLAEEAA